MIMNKAENWFIRIPTQRKEKIHTDNQQIKDRSLSQTMMGNLSKKSQGRESKYGSHGEGHTDQ